MSQVSLPTITYYSCPLSCDSCDALAPLGNHTLYRSLQENRLILNATGGCEVIPKSIGEVIGEHLLRPMIDLTYSLCKHSYRVTWNGFSAFNDLVSKVNLFAVAEARIIIPHEANNDFASNLSILPNQAGAFFQINGKTIYRGYGGLNSSISNIQDAIEFVDFYDGAVAYKDGPKMRRALMGKIEKPLVLASKIPGFKLDINDLKNSTEKCFKEIINELAVKKLDILYLHGPDCIHWEVLNVLERLQKNKKIQFIGLCNIDKRTLEKLINAGYPISVVQNEFNPNFWDEELLNYCHEKNIVFVGYRPFGEKEKTNVFKNKVLQKIAQKKNANVQDVILQWMNQHGVTPIPHSNNKTNIDTNAQVPKWTLSKDEMNQVDKIKQNGQSSTNWKKHLNTDLLKRSVDFINDLDAVDVRFVNSSPCSIDFSTIFKLKKAIEERVRKEFLKTGNNDGSHDIGHLHRVSALGQRFAKEEGANELVVYAAAMLHDIVNLPKNHHDSKNSSYLASLRAKEILAEINFPKQLIDNVCHAIEAHSFSANIEPRTVEAMIVQDSDRMQAIGAFGLMRAFYTSGKMGSKIMAENDPKGIDRELDDKKYALDHFPKKLFKLPVTMKTDAGRRMAGNLSAYLENFREGIIQDSQKGNKNSGRFQIANVYHRAGQNNITLFDSQDPFATSGRAIDPSKNALDGLLNSTNPYVNKFIQQLKFELGGYKSLQKNEEKDL